ncbi:ABC transporter permease [Muricomes sp. OA1]|uniref:ABC transporter permease n=1 Tax=Hungatella hathewayi TaxID=154046 RepID=A0A3E2X0C9_9FIRM|nr:MULTISPECIES: ABC transporter permease [Clostridia]MEE0203034.1 ABC transporter permease [Muricomes sp.]MCH1973849.1 ABC transporter permease [Muricomes sp. OA1]MRM87595.1 ABC transporter permease [Faecalicatena contorta]RGC34551.1 ABC transporter permease [Hungatella hathewayi]GKH32615.1 ribose ABC transporter permease [Faecalicatena contorta]
MKLKSKERKGTSYVGILIALIALCIVLTFTSKSFLTAANLLNVSQQISTNFLIAIGMTFIILLGGIDLSVGSVIAVTGLMMGIMMKSWDLPVAASLFLGLLFASVIGLVTGLLITGFDLPPFIATLGMMSIARGAAYTITEGQPIYTFPKEFLAITGRYGGIPVFTILIMIVMFVIAAYVLKYTKYGRYIYAIGGNENCAKLSGINVKKIKCIAYVISGFCCGVAAIVLTSRLDSAVPTNADGAELDAIAAVVIGGTSMNGGEGTLVGTIIGTMIIGIVANGLNLLNVPQGAQRMVKGGIIVLAVIVDVIRRKRSQKA